MQELLASQARPFDALLGSRALLARLSHRLERVAGGAVGLGERRFAQHASVGGLFPRRFRLVVFVCERMAPAGEFDRRVGEPGALLLRLRAALGELRDAGISAIEPLAPRRPLGGDRVAPRCARLRLAGERLRRSARFRECGPLARRGGSRALQAQRDIVARPEMIERGFGIRLALGGLIPRGAGARKGFLDRRKARQGLRTGSLELGEGVARIVRSGARRAHPLPPFRFRSGGPSRRVGRACRRRAENRGRLARGLGFALEVAEAVLLGEPARGRGRRLRRGDEAIPAPEIAFERDQPLAGLEKPAQPLSLRAGDDADLGQAAGERGRRLQPAQRAVLRPAADADLRQLERSATNAPAHFRRPRRRDRRPAPRRAPPRSRARR